MLSDEIFTMSKPQKSSIGFSDPHKISDRGEMSGRVSKRYMQEMRREVGHPRRAGIFIFFYFLEKKQKNKQTKRDG